MLTNFTVVDVPQRSPEWHTARLGRLTGSCAADMLAQIKSGEAAARRNLRMRLVCERLTGIAAATYQSAEMKWGIEHEPAALRAYEARLGELVESVGFLQHASLMAGCSPDGIVQPDGIVEAKCPLSATHLSYLRTRTVPSDYLAQCRHNMWVSQAQWCDFISYDPRFPAALQLLVVRVTMSDAERKSYELLLRMFLAECDREYEEVAAMAAAAA